MIISSYDFILTLNWFQVNKTSHREHPRCTSIYLY